jgi:hypothetical protein
MKLFRPQKADIGQVGKTNRRTGAQADRAGAGESGMVGSSDRGLRDEGGGVYGSVVGIGRLYRCCTRALACSGQEGRGISEKDEQGQAGRTSQGPKIKGKGQRAGESRVTIAFRKKNGMTRLSPAPSRRRRVGGMRRKT